jgi:hypothetical protein
MKYQLSVFNSGVITVINVALCIRINVIRRITFIKKFRFQKRIKNSIFKSYIIPDANV